jgi:hypothetical protein
VPIGPGFFSTNSSGGGIILYYQNYVNISRRLDLEHSQVESMWFELKTKLSPILININYGVSNPSHLIFTFGIK